MGIHPQVLGSEGLYHCFKVAWLGPCHGTRGLELLVIAVDRQSTLETQLLARPIVIGIDEI